MSYHHLVMCGGHWSRASRDIKYLTCQVTLQNHVIEGSSNFFEWELFMVYHHLVKFGGHRVL